MEENNKDKFIDGFNKGYLISKHRQELHEKLSDSLSEYEDSDVFIKGMIKGGEEAEFERGIDELDKLRGDSDEKEFGK